MTKWTKEYRLAYFREYNKRRPKVPRPNAKERNELMKARRAADPEKYIKIGRESYHRTKNNDRPSNKKEYKLWWSAKKRATKKDIPFSIEREDVIIPDVCPCCKEEMSRPSLDQIKPGEGYTKENVAVICLACNTIKSFGTSDQHRRIAEWMDEVTV